MSPIRTLTDAAILAGVRAATAAWNAPQDARYYGERRWGATEAWLGRRDSAAYVQVRLEELVAAGKLRRVPGLAFGADVYVAEE
jgi:hypothetical protein